MYEPQQILHIIPVTESLQTIDHFIHLLRIHYLERLPPELMVVRIKQPRIKYQIQTLLQVILNQ